MSTGVWIIVSAIAGAAWGLFVGYQAGEIRGLLKAQAMFDKAFKL